MSSVSHESGAKSRKIDAAVTSTQKPQQRERQDNAKPPPPLRRPTPPIPGSLPRESVNTHGSTENEHQNNTETPTQTFDSTQQPQRRQIGANPPPLRRPTPPIPDPSLREPTASNASDHDNIESLKRPSVSEIPTRRNGSMLKLQQGGGVVEPLPSVRLPTPPITDPSSREPMTETGTSDQSAIDELKNEIQALRDELQHLKENDVDDEWNDAAEDEFIEDGYEEDYDNVGDALSEEEKASWSQVIDPDTGDVFYWNEETEEMKWEL